MIIINGKNKVVDKSVDDCHAKDYYYNTTSAADTDNVLELTIVLNTYTNHLINNNINNDIRNGNKTDLSVRPTLNHLTQQSRNNRLISNNVANKVQASLRYKVFKQKQKNKTKKALSGNLPCVTLATNPSFGEG